MKNELLYTVELQYFTGEDPNKDDNKGDDTPAWAKKLMESLQPPTQEKQKEQPKVEVTDEDKTKTVEIPTPAKPVKEELPSNPPTKKRGLLDWLL